MEKSSRGHTTKGLPEEYCDEVCEAMEADEGFDVITFAMIPEEKNKKLLLTFKLCLELALLLALHNFKAVTVLNSYQ